MPAIAKRLKHGDVEIADDVCDSESDTNSMVDFIEPDPDSDTEVDGSANYSEDECDGKLSRDIDAKNIVSGKRVRKQTKRFVDELMALEADLILADVPENELDAAINDSDVDEDESEAESDDGDEDEQDGDEDEESSDSDYVDDDDDDEQEEDDDDDEEEEKSAKDDEIIVPCSPNKGGRQIEVQAFLAPAQKGVTT